MANSLAPSGFRYLGLKDGSPPNFGLARGFCAYNASALFQGDPLIASAGLLSKGVTTGNTGALLAGIAVSFSWISIAQQRRVWDKTYPGSDSVNNANVAVYFANNVNSLFETVVTSSSAGTAVGGPAVQADVGSYFNWATGAGGNTQSGLSSFSLDYSTKNATAGSLPFVLYYLDEAPVTDPTSAGNRVRVGFNAIAPIIG